MKFTIIKSCLARFSGIFAVSTPSNIHGTAISYRCAKFGAFVNSVTILTLRDLTKYPARPKACSQASQATKTHTSKFITGVPTLPFFRFFELLYRKLTMHVDNAKKIYVKQN